MSPNKRVIIGLLYEQTIQTKGNQNEKGLQSITVLKVTRHK